MQELGKRWKDVLTRETLGARKAPDAAPQSEAETVSVGYTDPATANKALAEMHRWSREQGSIRNDHAAVDALRLIFKRGERSPPAPPEGAPTAEGPAPKAEAKAPQPPSGEVHDEPGLTLDVFSRINAARCKAGFGRNVNDWKPAEWVCAVVGELGELANKIKKRDLRGETVADDDLAAEWADTFTYLNLLGQSLGLDGNAQEEVIVRKFNEVSDRRKCAIKLPVKGVHRSG
jgi:NTP pyrophosphatase (non-canonical NTP hydrolase)